MNSIKEVGVYINTFCIIELVCLKSLFIFQIMHFSLIWATVLINHKKI